MLRWLHRIALNFIINQHKKWVSGSSGIRLNMSGFNLEKADFSHANFQGAEMFEATFRFASIRNASLSGVDFTDSCFTKAIMRSCSFNEADMSFADISTAILRKATHQIHIDNVQKETLKGLVGRAQNLSQSLAEEKSQLDKLIMACNFVGQVANTKV